MASPQLEDGFTRIANEILDAMARLVLNSQESRCLWVIFRQTYGFRVKEASVTLTQFAEATGMIESHVSRTLAALQRRNVIIITRIGRANTYSIQKDHTKWDLAGPLGRMTKKILTHTGKLPVSVSDEILTHTGNSSLPIQVSKSLPIQVSPTSNKERSKERSKERVITSQKPKKKPEPNPLIREVTAAINEEYGEAYPEWAKHVRGIKQLLDLGYTVREIVGCWTDIWRQGDGRFPPISWVIDRIKSYRQNGGKLPQRGYTNGRTGKNQTSAGEAPSNRGDQWDGIDNSAELVRTRSPA